MVLRYDDGSPKIYWDMDVVKATVTENKQDFKTQQAEEE